MCGPSRTWLGNDAYPPLVRRSGIWNTQHVGGPVATRSDLDRFASLVRSTDAGAVSKGNHLDETLLLIPCSGGKDGAADPGLTPVHLAELLSPSVAALLEEGRGLAFSRPGVELEIETPLRPALAYYTGQPYATAGVREALVLAIQRGLHCLIVSGGYGVLRAEEPIHRYKAHLSRTRTVWSHRIPAILRDYVERHGISRTITTVSQVYASVIPTNLTGNDRRVIPAFSKGTDHGAALRVVPERVGAALVDELSDL